ncbi:MAG: hypothetical protein AVDCRST_MAG56-4855 [uncultured Cytophagales bacterium]|uniref:Uncharacterized protein n=1 Tax=uncultured Cytophagales bacterium TaxID=158755 RepID=A0A6J4K0U4_9SPHI|nr:MAG: hypothetical protein AVDCRST_MAG56-4855 [uncultured Cytophagales bacterium]
MAGPGLRPEGLYYAKNATGRTEKVEWTPRATNGGAPPGRGSFSFRPKMRKLNFSRPAGRQKKCPGFG